MTVLGTLKRNWWTLVLRGVFAIAFGFFAWFWPAATLLALLSIWGAFAIASGVITLLGAFTGAEARGMMLLEGGVSVLAGAVALFYPRLTALLFLYLLAAWALLGGALQIIAALRLRKEIRGEFWLGFAGVLSLLFGILLIAWPRAGALTIIWMIAGYAVLYGVVLIAWGLHLKRLHALGETTRIEIRVNQ